ncbi:methyltransferase LaeA: variant, partial [Diplocarpon mali]
SRPPQSANDPAELHVRPRKPLLSQHQTDVKPPQDFLENGRRYSGFRRGKYMFPVDEAEMDRMDIYHKFFSVARREALHTHAFIPNYDSGPRILDLGCGTGIWAIDMADKYHAQHAEVVGIDLGLIQPGQIPPNLRFVQRDIESPWHGLDLDAWDLIHMRMLAGSLSSWPDTYAMIFRHLKPGYGVMEHVEIDMEPRCDDGTAPPNSKLVEWTRLLLDATERAQRPLAFNTQTRAQLQRAGFVDIAEQIIKVPLNPWEKDPHLKDIGRWYNLGLTQGLQALSLGPLTRVRQWTAAEVEALIAEVKREVCSKRHHFYCN